MATSIKGLGDEALAEAVFDRVKVELAVLKNEQLLAVNLDISAAVATVLGVLPEVRALREQMVTELPLFDIGRVDKLEDYALALSYAQAKYLSATLPPDDLEALATEAARLRERLLAESRALAHHGLVSDAQLSQLKGAKGYKNIATDLMVLTNVLQEAWPQIQGKTPTTAEDLAQASRVATRLLRVVGLREQGPAQVAAATDLRLRAFTTLLRAYEEVRRAVSYLRAPSGDADTIAPSLFPGRPRRRASEPDTETETEVSGGTAPAGSGNGVPLVPGGSVAAVPAAGSSVAGAAVAAPVGSEPSGPFM